MNELTLLVGGVRFGGWTEVEVVRGIEQAAGTFRVVYTDRWDGQPTPGPIQSGAAVQVLMDGEVVVTGHVDRTLVEFDAQRHTLTVQGRDAAGDLVDSSAVPAHGGQWLKTDLLTIARELAAPFKVPVAAGADLGEPFDSFTLQSGETVHEAIDRMARMRGLLPMSDGRGGLVLARAGTATAGALIEGQNIKAARAELDLTGRYSTYICRGQIQALDHLDADTAYGLQGTAGDPGVERHRPLVVLAEDQGHQASIDARAEWECRRRAARGARLYITVQGWRDSSGALWKPNTRSAIRSPTLGVDGTLLISEVRQTLDGEGTLTQLTLGQPEAFDPSPKKAKRRKAKADKYAPL
ncbi:Mu-like prophage tail protein gpP [Methylomagnum ishizawai]|uniref:Mu-like prophage tail protein gpP n=1 Tax=Methylomagnum ishizawai TaxID=1760988 RepID=A0A1Y6CVP0_9GAMM|nr:contractile injection system protein, VgrG/Pvc8 family [Methylomagnum ishizawai]SMF94356.1 Mu-like prophage tail protein gpP [Methylomagnum ishizawai]